MEPLLSDIIPTVAWSKKIPLAFLKDFEKKENILWYPSSGNDLSDVYYFNSRYLPIDSLPNIFIHNDAMRKTALIDEKIGFFPERKLNNPTQGINAETEVLKFNEKDISITRIEFRHGIVKWLIYFYETDNLLFLKDFFLQYQMGAKYIITKCDGNLSGMGNGDLFRGLSCLLRKLYGTLGVKYHLTEYNNICGEEEKIAQLQQFLRENPDLAEYVTEPENDINIQVMAIDDQRPWNETCQLNDMVELNIIG